MNGYELSRKWFDFCFDNPEKIRPNHTALYMFAIEHCNRLGWKEKFGFPTEMAKDAIGVKNYRTYIKTINDLVSWGFIIMVERSKNQYSANIIAIANYTTATTKALDKATQKHDTKQSQSNYKSIDSIIKLLTIEQLNNKQIEKLNDLVLLYKKEKKYDLIIYRQFKHLKISIEENNKLLNEGYSQTKIDSIYDDIENYKKNSSYTSLYLTARKWLKKDSDKTNSGTIKLSI